MEKTTQIKAREKKNSIGTSIFIYALVIWPIIHFLVFWLYINIDTVFLTFQKFSIKKLDYVYVGLKNYEDLWKWIFESSPNDNLVYAIRNSISILLFNDFILIPVSLFFAYIMYKKLPFDGFFKAVFFLPNIISIVVLSMVFKLMWDPNVGLIQELLDAMNLGHITPKHGWFADKGTAWPMVIIYCLWAGIGYDMIMFLSGFNRIPPEISESAQLDGAGFLREFWSISLPLGSTTLATLLTLATGMVLTFYIQPMMLTNGEPNGRTLTIMFLIFSQVKSGPAGLNMSATIGIAFSIVFLPVVFAVKRIVEKVLPPIEF